jgi:hypothetical protein
LHKTLKEQADALAQRLRETFEAECRAGGIASQSLTFESDPIAELCSSAETHDLIVTGHDTAFRGNVHQQLSDILSKLLLITPRPMIVCPDELSNTTSILIAYDGRLPATRALQLFALFGIGLDRVVQVMLSMQAANWFRKELAVPRNIFDFMATRWTKPRLLLDCARQRFCNPK